MPSQISTAVAPQLTAQQIEQMKLLAERQVQSITNQLTHTPPPDFDGIPGAVQLAPPEPPGLSGPSRPMHEIQLSEVKHFALEMAQAYYYKKHKFMIMAIVAAAITAVLGLWFYYDPLKINNTWLYFIVNGFIVSSAGLALGYYISNWWVKREANKLLSQ